MPAIEPSAIFELLRSSYETTSAFFERKARQLSLEAALIAASLEKAEKPDLQMIRRQAFDILKKQEEKQQKENNLAHSIKEKTETATAVLSLAVLVHLIAEMSTFFTQPTPATAAVLAIMPPPVMIGVYAAVGLFNLVKLGFEIAKFVDCQRQLSFDTITEDQREALLKERHKAMMNMAQATLGVAIAATMIVANIFAPGIANIAAGVFLGVSVVLASARLLRGSAQGYNMLQQQSSLRQHNISDDYRTTNHFGKALMAYLSARWALYQAVPLQPSASEAFDESALHKKELQTPPPTGNDIIESQKPIHVPETKPDIESSELTILKSNTELDEKIKKT
jgi:hypothetical protein